MDDVGIFFEGDVIPNREHMTTRAARTGGPGGLCFSAGLGVGSRLLSKEERRSPPLPYPTAFQPAWRTTWVSLVEAERSGATDVYMAPVGHRHDRKTIAQTKRAIRP